MRQFVEACVFTKYSNSILGYKVKILLLYNNNTIEQITTTYLMN